MFYRQAFKIVVCFFLLSLLSSPAFSQWEDVCRFKAVQIPFDLKCKDTMLPKGKYDLIVIKHTGQGLYYLRIKKRREKLCLISGETIPYIDFEEIPEKPKLRMRRNPVENMLHIIFESGTITWKYSNVKARFKIEYLN